jgi:hypothetical protein
VDATVSNSNEVNFGILGKLLSKVGLHSLIGSHIRLIWQEDLLDRDPILSCNLINLRLNLGLVNAILHH